MGALTFFTPVFQAVLMIFIIGLVSGLLLRRGVLKPEHIESLSHITVTIFLPSLTFSKIVHFFKPQDFHYWWVLPLMGVLMLATGMAISSLMYLRQLKAKRNLIGIAAFMNANYMVLPIGKLVFPNQFDIFVAYTFLFVLGVMPMLWSVGKFMVTSSDDVKFSAKQLLTPPLVSIVLSVILVLAGFSEYIPKWIMQPVDFMGEAAIPSVTLVLGATLGAISLRKLPPFIDVVKVLSTKLLILPALTIYILLHTSVPSSYPLIADIIVIEASVAPATQIIIQVRKYGGDVQTVGGMMLLAYSFCLVTIPAWFTVWSMLK